MAFGKKAKALIAEGNYYYDTEKCYIGFHGDSERKIVIGLRLGDSFPLHYRWYERSEPIGERLEIDLHNGDLYAMSEKAVGTDWKRSSITTLRHAAGYPSSLGLKTIDPVFSLKRPEYILDSQGYVVVASLDPFMEESDIFDSLYQAEELLIKRAVWNIYCQHLKTEDERSLLELELHFSRDKKAFIDKMTDVYSPEEILRYWYLHFSPKDATEEKVTLLTTKYSSDIPKLWKNLYYKYVIEE